MHQIQSMIYTESYVTIHQLRGLNGLFMMKTAEQHK